MGANARKGTAPRKKHGKKAVGSETAGVAVVKHASEPQATLAPTESDYAVSLEFKATNEETVQVISFYLGPDQYALDVAEAVEVLKPRPLTDVPHTPEFVRGIVSVRGEMIPVIDLKMRLGAGSSARGRTGRVLVASVDDLKAGFAVDRLFGVMELPARLLREVEADKSGFVKAVYGSDKHLVRLLDTRKLIDFSI